MILEALIAILIFSLGILAIVALQAVSIKQAADAKYRTDASLLADELLAQMWTSDRVPANMQATFGSVAAGAGYTAWLAGVNAALPGAAANPPIVMVDTTAGTATTGTTTITVRWQVPTETVLHSQTVMAQIR